MSLLDPILPASDERPVKWGRLYGAAPALAIAEAAPAAAGPLLVIAQNSREAETLSEEIRFFAGPNLNVRVFPDLETLPYDSFSAHPDITSARLAAAIGTAQLHRGLLAQSTS
jgi:transcription-repair coupling factor (superfamily II helicase)